MSLPYQDFLANEITYSVNYALEQDLGFNGPLEGDLTANLIPAQQQARATIITREPGVFVGKAWVEKVFALLGGNVSIQWQVQDGDRVAANDTLCTLTGPARDILTGERTALNFVQTLSATATATANCVALLAGSHTQILDTRKTLPGMRFGQKYAVYCGGGKNHRIGLYDAYLIKENHILACGSIAEAVATARSRHPDILIEVEVESLSELNQAIEAKADVVMLDNFSLADLESAVKINQGRVKLEVSGNITPASLGKLKALGVDYISSGALTKHVRALDLSLRLA